MSPKLNPRKNLRRQQQSEEDLPATARVPAYSASAKAKHAGAYNIAVGLAKHACAYNIAVGCENERTNSQK